MKRAMRFGVGVMLMMAVLAVGGIVTGAQNAARPGEIPKAQAKDGAGAWSGTWTSADGFVFDALAVIEIRSDNTVSGSITWTAKAAPAARTDYKNKIGLKGVEHIKGVFYPDARLIGAEGVSKDDPDQVIGLDKYRLYIGDSGKTMAGITSHYDRWDAFFVLER
jgi:hypothetical protein